MNIINTYYNEDMKSLTIDFSLKEDNDEYYRTIDLSYDEIMYYTSEVIIETDLFELDDDFFIDIIENYLLTNDLPEQTMF